MDLSETAKIATQAHLPVDLEMVATSVFRSLAGEVPLAHIEQLLRQLLQDDEFRSARVMAYLPIFLQRAARDRLCNPSTPAQGH